MISNAGTDTDLVDQAMWLAPAKLNLCLHIVGRRADGYHLLQTAFQFIDWCDELRFTLRSDSQIVRVSGAEGVAPEHDLVVRAAQLLRVTTQTQRGVNIELTKRIPMGAGLGGGSSDAATVLVALNQLWQLHLSIDELASLGLRLGADVPVFVRGQAAWAEGVGEQLTPVTLPTLHYLVIKPPVMISTAEIFQAPELTRDTPLTTIRAFLAGGGRNDCTATVRSRYPIVAQALDWLAGFGDAKLTGTGACVFAGWSERSEAERVFARMQQECPADWLGFVAQGCNRSPLFRR